MTTLTACSFGHASPAHSACPLSPSLPPSPFFPPPDSNKGVDGVDGQDALYRDCSELPCVIARETYRIVCAQHRTLIFVETCRVPCQVSFVESRSWMAVRIGRYDVWPCPTVRDARVCGTLKPFSVGSRRSDPDSLVRHLSPLLQR